MEGLEGNWGNRSVPVPGGYERYEGTRQICVNNDLLIGHVLDPYGSVLCDALHSMNATKDIHGIKTDILVQGYSDRVLVLVTQLGKVGSLVLTSQHPQGCAS